MQQRKNIVFIVKYFNLYGNIFVNIANPACSHKALFFVILFLNRKQQEGNDKF